jgi:hypothetical protein
VLRERHLFLIPGVLGATLLERVTLGEHA